MCVRIYIAAHRRLRASFFHIAADRRLHASYLAAHRRLRASHIAAHRRLLDGRLAYIEKACGFCLPKPSRFWSTAALAIATLLEEVNASITLLKSLVSLPKPKYDEVPAKERSRLSHLIGAQHNSAMSLAQVADTISTA